MSKIVELFKSKWISVVEKTMENGSKYIYSKAEWCNSEGVAILPYRIKIDYSLTERGVPVREFLGRYEVCPAHSNEIELCSITGGMDKEGESASLTAWRELIEEGGYEVPLENIIYLGSVRPSKGSDNTTHLFTVDLDMEAKKVEATGDGTLFEEGAFCDWISKEQLFLAKDPLLHAMYVRLEGKSYLINTMN